jgi:hypothetical protein
MTDGKGSEAKVPSVESANADAGGRAATADARPKCAAQEAEGEASSMMRRTSLRMSPVQGEAVSAQQRSNMNEAKSVFARAQNGALIAPLQLDADISFLQLT